MKLFFVLVCFLTRITIFVDRTDEDDDMNDDNDDDIDDNDVAEEEEDDDDDDDDDDDEFASDASLHKRARHSHFAGQVEAN